jgi:predicted kinase
MATVRPVLIVMKGHPATGKSALALALARRLTWPLIDKDDAKDLTLDLPDANRRAYAIMWRIVERQIELGISAIAVSPLSSVSEFRAAQGIARRHRARLLVVETRLDEVEWRRRLEARSPEESPHKVRGWSQMKRTLRRYAGSWGYRIPPSQHVAVDAARPLPELVQILLRRLDP